MDTEMIENSGNLTLRGIIATLFGVAAVFWPDLTLKTLVYLFSAFVLLNGLIDMVSGIGHLMNGSRTLISRVLSLLFSLFEIGVGVYLLRHPLVTFGTFILLIGFTLVIRGIVEIVQGLFADDEGSSRLLLVIMGLLALLAGIVVLFQPAASGVAFVWIVGLYALITGPLLIALGLEVHKAEKASAVR